MNHRYSYLLIVLLIAVITGCQDDAPGEFSVDGPNPESGTVVNLKSARTDGVISLSIDAPENKRSNIWIDLNGDGRRAENGTEEVKTFNIYQSYTLAADVSEISVYGDITYLAAASNELTEVYISENPYLTTLNIPLNRLTTIDVSKNTILSRLDISGNDIHTLNTSANTALMSLWCFNNKLTELNVSNNTRLAFLDCSGNQLKTLDITANTQLEHLLAYNNQLTAIDISRNNQLDRLWVFDNQLPDKEAESIVSTLRSVTKGDLWLSTEPLNSTLSKVAASKGWSLH
jgi:hypothetical protein